MIIKKYLITSPSFYGDNSSQFITKLKEQYKKHQPDYMLYRDKNNAHYDSLARDFIQTCHELKNVKSFLHQKVDLAKMLGATGVHLTSNQFDEISYAKSLGLEVVVSTHTFEEVQGAEKLGADAVTYSPIFFSPNKGEPKGIEDLRSIVKKSKIKIFALGGILDEEQVESVREAKAYGFASIRYFE